MSWLHPAKVETGGGGKGGRKKKEKEKERKDLYFLNHWRKVRLKPHFYLGSKGGLRWGWYPLSSLVVGPKPRAHGCGGGGREGMAYDVHYQLARQSSKGTVTDCWHWCCHPQLTGVRRTWARWVNPNSTGGWEIPCSSQIPTTVCNIYKPALAAFFWCNWTANGAGIFLLPHCSSAKPSWRNKLGFWGKTKQPQLILKQVPLVSGQRGPAICCSLPDTQLQS